MFSSLKLKFAYWLLRNVVEADDDELLDELRKSINQKWQ